MRRLAHLCLVSLLATGLVACGNGGHGKTTLTVLGAASLTESFTTLEKRFEDAHSDVDVKLAFDSSATLAGQAVDGAPGDVLATADEATMGDAVDGGAVDGEPVTFATNSLTLVVPADNPAGITSFSDLGKGDVEYAVCVATAPCGKSAAAVLEADGIDADPATEEVDVKAVLQKVVSGEADAGLVYVTDATTAGDAVLTFDVPGAEDQLQTYPIAVLKQSKDSDLAQEFIDLVTSQEGQQVLQDAGFGKP